MATAPDPQRRPTNWAGNVTFTPAEVHEPRSVAELQELVAAAPRIRALGTRHSFNRVADSEQLVSVRRLPSVVEVDPAARTVRVSAGTRYGELGAALLAAGYGLPNTGSLPHISVAGAVSTGTHGSGVRNPWLGAQVRALTLVRADGELVSVSRESVGEAFDGHVLALGRLGVVTELVLDVVPTYDVAQTVVVGLSDDCLVRAIGPILSAAYSVSVFTTWEPDGNRVWVKQRTDRAGDLAGGPALGRPSGRCPAAPGAGRADGVGDRAARRAGSLERADAALPARVRAQRRRGAAVRVLRGRRRRRGGLDRSGRHARPDPAGALRQRDPRRRGGPGVARPDRRTRQRGVPLHLAPGRRAGRPGAGRGRAPAGAVRGPAALGQGVHDAAASGWPSSTRGCRSSASWSGPTTRRGAWATTWSTGGWA